MSRFDKDEETGYGTAFRDILFGLVGLLFLVLFILLVLPHKPADSNDEQQRSRGNIRVEIFWPNEMDVDVDLWGQAPGLPAVGYSNMNGPVLNLVRDDLGAYADITGINYEVMFSRGLPPGDWTFNIHWFSNASNEKEIPVRVIITTRKDDTEGSKERPKQIVTTTLTLRKVGQEITIVRFKMDEDGDIITDSINSIKKPIRVAAPGDDR